MSKITKSAKTTWWLFSASHSSAKTILMSRLTLIFTPILIGVGVAISFSMTFNPFVGVFLGLATLILVASAMIKSSSSVVRNVDSFLSEDEPNIVGASDYIKAYEIETKSKYRPAFYYSAGEWMCIGHAPIKEFIEAIQEADNILHQLPYEELENAVEYHYALESFSPTLQRDVLRIVPSSTPNCTPITRLRISAGISF